MMRVAPIGVKGDECVSHNYADWIGNQDSAMDMISLRPARFMQATLDRDPDLREGDVLPPLWHWLYFHDAKPERDLGRDGHPKKGGFLPPVALPRRMWAGGRFTFERPVKIGVMAEKRSSVLNVVEKTGRSGDLCFVTVQHEIFQNEKLCLTEEHDIVYREDPGPNAPKRDIPRAPQSSEFSRDVQPTEVMLFRYSALTFNGHRIHYDVDYARAIEGYDGLVFHGPLTATLLIDLACSKTGAFPKSFSFRGVSALAGMNAFKIQGHQTDNAVDLWAKTATGDLAMSARAEF
jgi:3-methylfumaryl-CoA hydratase